MLTTSQLVHYRRSCKVLQQLVSMLFDKVRLGPQQAADGARVVTALTGQTVGLKAEKGLSTRRTHVKTFETCQAVVRSTFPVSAYFSRKSYLRTLREFILSILNVLVLSCPGTENWRLQGTSVAERQGPRLLSGVLVDGIEVDGRFFFWLTSWEESDSWKKNTTCQILLYFSLLLTRHDVKMTAFWSSLFYF